MGCVEPKELPTNLSKEKEHKAILNYIADERDKYSEEAVSRDRLSEIHTAIKELKHRE